MDYEKEIVRFISYLSPEKQPSTLRRYRYDLIQFFTWLEKAGDDEKEQRLPGKDEGAAYYSYLTEEAGYAPATIRRILAVLRQWFLYFEDYLAVNLIEGFINETKVTLSSDEPPFLLPEEVERIFETLPSDRGLTENQLKYRHLIRDRNEAVFRLIIFYGLTIQELTNLTLDHIHFTSNELELISRKGKKRKKTIDPEDRRKLFQYYMSVPEPVRPNRYDNAPFLIAFDYQRGTYRWDYKNNRPKNLTEVSLQKMIRQEMQRAGLPNKSAQQLRKTYIINQLIQGIDKKTLRDELAFETTQPLDDLAEWALQIKERGFIS
ncbi:tyrosine-type recombinase/integrase [Evansella clarkii]|uniref:tyrosine-type recombinase/integrase n=1 Tax=Evansella clarkii TaxID=79879 RepID=UPI00099722BD|nr:site-specific integrase [Evansella clarkii]